MTRARPMVRPATLEAVEEDVSSQGNQAVLRGPVKSLRFWLKPVF
ncbi:MAG: hypothetical protein QW797_08615 [Thermoproteota archaeon]